MIARTLRLYSGLGIAYKTTTGLIPGNPGRKARRD